MGKLKLMRLIIFLMFSVLIISSCNSSKTTSSGESDAKATLDEKRSVEKAIKASLGGQISLDTAEGDKVKLLFPQGALAKDASLVAVPLSKAPIADNNLLIKGFSLEEKGTGQGPAMQSPALILITAKGTLPKDATIIKYHEDGQGYDVIPTKVRAKDGKSILLAQVDGFSKYGVSGGNQTSAQKSTQQKGAKKSGSKFKPQNYNWVIIVNDKTSYNYGGMKSTIKINLKATNTSGNINGTYTGTIKAITDNEMEVNGGKVNTKGTVEDNNLQFQIDMYASLAPLVPDDNKLAPLVPDNIDFIGKATLNMTDKHSGTITAQGRSVSGNLPTFHTVNAMDIAITGIAVKLTIQGPSGPLYFKGIIRGELKK